MSAPMQKQDSFMDRVSKQERHMTPMAKLQIILEKRGEDRSFDELLIVRTQTNQIPCLKAAMSNLLPTQVDDLCRNMMLEFHPAGGIVFKQGDIGDKFYVILSGSCDIRIKTAADLGGKEVIAVTYHDGQQFGERALDYEEPRAATVQASIDTYLIAFSTVAYKKILKNTDDSRDGAGGGTSMKDRITQIMSKNRNNRQRDELAAVVTHICPKVQFLQKFSYEQQIELFRVCDFVTLWGKTTLFKQGTTGEAFYIVVSGHVNVFVNKIDAAGVLVEIEVAKIHAGSSFGEKALESGDSKRTATCITCDSSTELLVIGKEEYNKLIVMVQQKDFSEKVALLRRTHLFQAMDLATLAEVGKLMEYRSWRVNSIVYVAGEVANSFVILQTGEFGIKSEVFMKDGSSKVLDFGRVGPAAVLGTNSFQCELFSDEVLCAETVTATTNCTGYVVTKYDMFHRLPKEHYASITTDMKYIEPPRSDLWDTTPHEISEEDWKIKSVWASYRKDVLKSFFNPLTNRTPNILAKVQQVEKKFEHPSGDCSPYEGHVDNEDYSVAGSSVSTEDKAEELTSMSAGIPSPNSRSRRNFTKSTKPNVRTADIMKVHEEEPDSFPLLGGGDDRGQGDPLSTKDRQVNFSEAQIGSMSFGVSPPGSPGSQQSRPSSRGLTPDHARTTSAQTEGGTSMKESRSNKSIVGIPKRQHFALPPSMGSMRQFSLHNSVSFEGNTQGLGSVKSTVACNVYRPPFCLLQLHREKLKMRPIQGSRRLLKCYFRVCGLVGSCNEAKLAAETQMLNISVRIKGNDGTKHYSGRTTTLNWNRFSGFSTMPLQNTDHFLIYCRGSPIEYASFTPPVGADLLEAPFPSACKPTGQQYACLSVYRIVAPRPSNTLYGEEDLAELQGAEIADDPLAKPLLLKEMSAIVEAMGTTSSRLDALRYAFNLAEQSEIKLLSAREAVKTARWSTVPDSKLAAITDSTDGPKAPQRLITVPLFVWLHISEDTFRFYDHADFSMEELNNEDKFTSMMRNRLLPRQDMAIAVSELHAAHVNYKTAANSGSHSKTKSVSEELKDAIASVGQVLNDGVTKINIANEQRGTTSGGKRNGPALNRSASSAILNNERSNRALFSTVESRLKQLGAEASIFSCDQSQNSTMSTSSNSGANDVRLSRKGVGEMSSIEVKIQALRDNIATRQKVLSLNDDLCKVEMKLKNENGFGKPTALRSRIEQSSVITCDPDGDLEEDKRFLDSRMTPAELALTRKRLVEKRLEIFDALQELPHDKFYSNAADNSSKNGNSKYGRGKMPPLKGDTHRISNASGIGFNTRKNKASSRVKNNLSALESVTSYSR